MGKIIDKIVIVPCEAGFYAMNEFNTGKEASTRELALGAFVNEFWHELGLSIEGL